jgi:hypothetical protein
VHCTGKPILLFKFVRYQHQRARAQLVTRGRRRPAAYNADARGIREDVAHERVAAGVREQAEHADDLRVRLLGRKDRAAQAAPSQIRSEGIQNDRPTLPPPARQRHILGIYIC